MTCTRVPYPRNKSPVNNFIALYLNFYQVTLAPSSMHNHNSIQNYKYFYTSIPSRVHNVSWTDSNIPVQRYRVPNIQFSEILKVRTSFSNDHLDSNMTLSVMQVAIRHSVVGIECLQYVAVCHMALSEDWKSLRCSSRGVFYETEHGDSSSGSESLGQVSCNETSSVKRSNTTTYPTLNPQPDHVNGVKYTQCFLSNFITYSFMPWTIINLSYPQTVRNHLINIKVSSAKNRIKVKLNANVHFPFL